MQTGIGFLSRFSFAVTELGGQVAVCDGVSVSDGPQGSAEAVGSWSESFLLRSQPGISNSILHCSPNVPRPGVGCDRCDVRSSFMAGTVFQRAPVWTGMGVSPATKWRKGRSVLGSP